MRTRALIVLLLVLNLGVAAWWWALRPAPAAPAAEPEGVPRLRLLSDVPAGEPARRVAAPPPAPSLAPGQAPAATAPTPPASAVPAPAGPAPACYSIGPFADPAAAGAARARLPPGLASVALRTQASPRRGAWSVLMPPQADRAAAQALAQRIEAAGFQDYYVIGEGEGANGIALGRFGAEEAARRHQAALQAAGFAVQVQAPAGAGAAHWLDVQAGPNFDAAAARVAIGGARVQPRACSAGASQALR